MVETVKSFQDHYTPQCETVKYKFFQDHHTFQK